MSDVKIWLAISYVVVAGAFFVLGILAGGRRALRNWEAAIDEIIKPK